MVLSAARAVEAAVERTRRLLFRPFDFSKWIHVGFGAWLVSLGENGGGLQLPLNFIGNPLPRDSGRVVEQAFRDLDNLEWAALLPIIVSLVAGVVALGLVLTYISCRGRYMLLDNVVRDRQDVRSPWQRAAPAALSLFLWRVALGFIALAAFVGGSAVFMRSLLGIVFEKNALPELLNALPALTGPNLYALGGTLLCFGLLTFVTLVIMDDFVLLLMWKHGTKAGAAWSMLLPLVAARPTGFVAYLLLKLVITIAIGFGLILASLATCCMGLLLLVIPFVNAVVMLPISVFFQLNAVYFLQQAGPDFDAFDGIPENDDEPPAFEPPEFEGRPSDPDNPYSPLR